MQLTVLHGRAFDSHLDMGNNVLHCPMTKYGDASLSDFG